ncbi:MAG: hypothetical protein MR910_01950 [Clostridiales bacterium]|nr:hypothetical protein [Clostridiales bacterium]
MEQTTFAELGLKENDVEELLRKNVELLCDEEDDSMLIVGQQVKNAASGRLDLTAIDKEGDLVLIEIKRDKKDIEKRKEAFEIQAIRYAASCATINSTGELIQDFFIPYVEKHREEYPQTGLTTEEIAKRKLDEFIQINGITAFNAHQKIILVASEFDAQTLSAVAWLNSNQVDISCYQICLFKLGGHILFDVKKLLPVENYYVNINKSTELERGRRTVSRRQLPKIEEMMTWEDGVREHDIIVAKGTDKEAVLLANGQVQAPEGIMSLQKWLKMIYGWSSVQTYAFAVLKRERKTLEEIRALHMKKEQGGEENQDDAAD